MSLLYWRLKSGMFRANFNDLINQGRALPYKFTGVGCFEYNMFDTFSWALPRRLLTRIINIRKKEEERRQRWCGE